jgi:hypothetical protein
MVTHTNITEGNQYLQELCQRKGLPAPARELRVSSLNNMIALAEAANTKSGKPVTQFHSKEKVAAPPTIKASPTQFSAKTAPLTLQAESYEEQNARLRAKRENSPEANGAWIRAMVKAGTVSAPKDFVEAVKDLQTLGCSKAHAVSTAAHAYPEVHREWLASADTSKL